MTTASLPSVVIALAGTRGIANAAVAEAATATAIKPALINCFIEISFTARGGNEHKFPSNILFHAGAQAVSTAAVRTQFPTGNISRSKEPLFRLLICQAVMIHRWEQNK
jgi:hypothetical protein